VSGREPWHGLGEVLESEPVAAGRYRRLVLQAPTVARLALPGQFVHVLCPAGAGAGAGLRRADPPGRPFLRRPFSISEADPASGSVTLLFRVKGAGTASLAAVRPGEVLDIVGPLGGGPFPGAGGRPAVVVGGGIGVAPLPFLVETLLGGPGPADGPAHAPGGSGAGSDAGAAAASVRVLAGVAEGRDLDLLEPLQRFEGRAEVRLATEDGAPGTVKGPVTALLGEALERAGEEAVVYACGPRAMLAAVRRLAVAAGVEAWLSVEERMACGVGACRGCAVKVKGDPPYRLVCRDGPVFQAAVLDLEEGEEP